MEEKKQAGDSYVGKRSPPLMDPSKTWSAVGELLSLKITEMDIDNRKEQNMVTGCPKSPFSKTIAIFQETTSFFAKTRVFGLIYYIVLNQGFY